MITHNQLDTPIKELEEGATNEQSFRQFIRESEEEFGMSPRNLEELSEKELNDYIDFIDDLWNK
jgi:hypothetical protein